MAIDDSCLTASAVIAKFVDLLLAQRATDFFFQYGNFEPIHDCGVKKAWLHDSVCRPLRKGLREQFSWQDLGEPLDFALQKDMASPARYVTTVDSQSEASLLADVQVHQNLIDIALTHRALIRASSCEM